MSLTYTQYVAQISNMLVIGSTDPNFLTMLPGMIDYAEGRCYRELDPLVTRVSTTLTLSSGVQTAAIPTTTGYFRVVENLAVYTSTTVSSSNAIRSPITMLSLDMVQAMYPSAADQTGIPLYASFVNDGTLYFGPSPSAGYRVELVGVIQPTPLSSSNTTTFLTNYLPDLFIAASMVFGAGYQRDFGAGTDTPQMSQSWEMQYTSLLKSATVELLRQKYQSGGWTHAQPSPIATPPRA